MGGWLARIIWPLASKVLVGLGLGTVTFVGLQAALNAALGVAKTALSGIGGDLLQILAMAGLFQAFAIVAGGLIASVAFIALKRFSFQTGS